MAGAEKSFHNFTSSGGTYSHAETFTRNDLQIWGAIGTGTKGGILAFGVGQPGWQIGIEITIPLGRNLNTNGQLVRDEDGNLFLAHQGGLGGGKYSVKRDQFATKIHGFGRMPVYDGDVVREMFVIANVDVAQDMESLAAYVHEAKRLREIRRAQAQAGATEPSETEQLPKSGGVEGGWYTRAKFVEYELLHELVSRLWKSSSQH